MKSSVFQIILLASFAAFAVVGVLIFAFAVGSTKGNSVGPLVIWGTLDGSSFSTLLRQVSDKNDAFLAVSYVQKDPATFETELTQAIASGTGPDLFILRQDYAVLDTPKIQPIPYTGSGSLSRSQFESTFIDVTSPFLSEQGVLAVPFLVDPLVLYWNKDILNTYSFAQPPQYWDQIPAMVASITKKDDTGAIVLSAIPMGEYANVNNAKDILSLLILQAGGLITTYDNGKLTPVIAGTVGNSIGATEKALDFYTSFANPSRDTTYTWNRSLPSSRAAFAAGKSALYIGFASENALIHKMNPNINFAITRIPQIRNAAVAIDVARVYGFAIPRNAKNPSGSLALAYTLASSENSAIAAKLFALPSARRDVLAMSTDGDMRVFNAEAIRSHTWVDPDPIATEDIFKTMIENTTSGSVPLLTDVVQRAQQQLSHIFGI